MVTVLPETRVAEELDCYFYRDVHVITEHIARAASMALLYKAGEVEYRVRYWGESGEEASLVLVYLVVDGVEERLWVPVGAELMRHIDAVAGELTALIDDRMSLTSGSLIYGPRLPRCGDFRAEGRAGWVEYMGL